jgi:hypothetical protein
MLSRCRNSNTPCWNNYGGRGIKVCRDWESFENFYRDMIGSWSKGLTLDRIDNDGNYTLENCRWTTRSGQINNSRRVRGEKHPFSKLKENQVVEIKNLIRLGETFSSIAKKFSVCVPTISGISRGKSWKHVK